MPPPTNNPGASSAAAAAAFNQLMASAGPLRGAIAGIESTINAVSSAASAMGSRVSSSWRSASSSVSSATASMTSAAIGGLETITAEAIYVIHDVAGAMSAGSAQVVSSWQTASNAASAAVSRVSSITASAMQSLSGTVSTAAGAVAGSLAATAAVVWKPVVSAAAGAANAIGAAWSSVPAKLQPVIGVMQVVGSTATRVGSVVGATLVNVLAGVGRGAVSAFGLIGQASQQAANAGNQAAQQQQKNLNQTTSAASGLQKAVSAISEAVRGMGLIFAIAGSMSASSILRMVSVADPGVFYQFTQTMTNLSGVLGQMFAPVVNAATMVIRELVTWLYNLPPSAKAMIAAVGIASVAVVAGLGAMTTAILLVNVALTAFNTLTGGTLLVVGLVVTAVAALAAGGLTVAASYGQLGNVFKDFQAGLQPVLNVASSVLSQIWEAAKPAITYTWDLMRQFVDWCKPAWDSLLSVIAGIQAAFGAMQAVFATLGVNIGDVFTSAMQTVAAQINATMKWIDGAVDTVVKNAIMAKALFDAMMGDAHAADKAVKAWIDYLTNKAKNKAKLEVDAKKPAPGKAPDDFGQRSTITGIAEAKELYWKAAMEASSRDPQVKAIDNVADKQKETNKILLDIKAAFGAGVPIQGGGLGR